MNEIEWEMMHSISFTFKHSLLFRAEYKNKGIQKEIHTPVNNNGKFGKTKIYFFIDDDKREFETEEELIKTIDELSGNTGTLEVQE